MAEFTIRPLKVGKISYYRGAFNSNQEMYKEREDFPILIFYIEGNGRKILFDTGGGDPATESMKVSYHGPGIERKPEEAPDVALRAIGVDPSEIDTVIISHLHWDHSYNNHLFPQADFYVQKMELINAVVPLPKFKITYETFYTGVVPPWARQGTKWKIIDGDYHLCDGIDLITLPGHTLGLQAALINTAKGRFLLASDAVPLYDCIDTLAEGTYNLSGLCADIDAYYKTFDRMRDLQENQGVKIIASHDFRSLDLDMYPC